MIDNRRTFLKTMVGATTGLVLAQAAGRAEAETCAASPEQTTGPFIPDDFPFREANEGHPYIIAKETDADFTRIAGRAGAAKGQAIVYQGQVVDENCQPVPQATVYVWQADDAGHYNHSEDPNINTSRNPSGLLDQNFQYRGIVATDSKGRFEVKTVKPKYYPLDPRQPDFMRTAHMHIAVIKQGFKNLFTQTYFEGEALEDIETIRRLNKIDIILGEWRGRRPTGRINPTFLPLVVEFRKQPGSDAPVGQVRLSIQR